MKTKDELDAIKEEIDALNEKLAELTDEEFKQVTGGNWWPEYYGEDGFFRGGVNFNITDWNGYGQEEVPSEGEFIPSKWETSLFNYKR